MTKNDLYFDGVATTMTGIVKEAYYEGRADERKPKLDLIQRLVDVLEGPATINGATANVRNEAIEYLCVMAVAQPKTKPPVLRESDFEVEKDRDIFKGIDRIRITHKPTGLFATCGKHKSDHKNKQEALEDLRAKIETQWAGTQEKPKEYDSSRDPLVIGPNVK